MTYHHFSRFPVCVPWLWGLAEPLNNLPLFYRLESDPIKIQETGTRLLAIKYQLIREGASNIIITQSTGIGEDVMDGLCRHTMYIPLLLLP